MAKPSFISSKYKEIVSKSSLIHSGSPAVYQLKPKKETFGTLTRLTVGERNLNQINKNILLMGETGAGKSTLINSLVNYTMGVKFEDNIWFEIVEEENRSQTESQTSDVIVYEIFGFEAKTLPYSLTIIDTPGYGDTRGLDNDDTVSERLFDLFRSEDGVHEISAVGLVMKASENRLSDRLRYIFNSVMSLFGKDMEKNIVTLITNSNGVTPVNVLKALEATNVKCAKNEKNQPVHFLFDNCQSTERTEDNEFGLDNAWRVTERGMKQFSTFLERSTPQKLTTTVEVLNTSVRLTACIQNLRDRIRFIEGKHREIQQTQDALKNHEEEMKKNEKFTVEVEEVYKVKETIKGGKWKLLWVINCYEGAVCCTVCEENCHYPGCTMAQTPGKCEVMKGGRCTSCTRKCLVSNHVKEEWIYVTKTRRVRRTLEDVKKKYEKNKAESESEASLLETLEKQMKDLTTEKNQLVEESYQHVVRLEQIALDVNSASTYVDFDFLIKKMKEKGDTKKVQKLEEMEGCRKLDKGVMESLRYRFGKLTGAEKTAKENK